MDTTNTNLTTFLYNILDCNPSNLKNPNQKDCSTFVGVNEFAKNNNHQAFDEIINKTVQFLSVKDNKDKFRVIVDNQFNENQEIIFNAELYNNSYELVNTPEVKLELENEAGVDYEFVFNKTGSAYVLNAGILPVGSYSYLASTTFSGEQYVVKGQLQILSLIHI